MRKHNQFYLKSRVDVKDQISILNFELRIYAIVDDCFEIRVTEPERKGRKRGREREGRGGERLYSFYVKLKTLYSFNCTQIYFQRN